MKLIVELFVRHKQLRDNFLEISIVFYNRGEIRSVIFIVLKTENKNYLRFYIELERFVWVSIPLIKTAR